MIRTAIASASSSSRRLVAKSSRQCLVPSASAGKGILSYTAGSLEGSDGGKRRLHRLTGLETTTPASTASMPSEPQHMRHSTRNAFYSPFPTSNGAINRTQRRKVSTWMESQGWRLEVFLQESTTKEKEEWLESMLANNYKEVDTGAFLVVLRALAESSANYKEDSGAARRAERWMLRLQDHRHATPTAECYQSVIEAWANSGHEKVTVSVNRAERWLNELLAESEKQFEASRDEYGIRYDNAVEPIQPTIQCYNAFLDACTRGRPGSDKRETQLLYVHVKKADALLRRLHSEAVNSPDGYSNHPYAPNTDSFNFVVRGWTRIKDYDIVPKKVIQYIQLMESFQRDDPLNSTIRPNTKSYSMAIDALATLAGKKARRCVRDDNSRFIKDVSKNGVQEMADAHEILQYIHNLYEAGVDGVVPHTVPYNIVLTGYANLSKSRHNNAPLKAEEVLRKMQSMKDEGFTDAAPDRISYEKVILAWANSEQPNAGKRASWWLKKLWNDSELEEDPRLLPTVQTYNVVIQANAKVEGPLAAENLLLDLGDRYKSEKNESLRPNSESFNIVVRSFLAASNESSTKQEGVGLLRRGLDWLFSLREAENEIDLSTSPELYINALKTAKKYARKDLEVFDLANRAFQDMKESRHVPPYVMYCLMLEIAISALNSDEHQDEQYDFICHLFKECCDDGMVSARLVRTVARYYDNGWTFQKSKAAMSTLVPHWPIPLSWCQNLPHRDFMPKEKDTLLVKYSKNGNSWVATPMLEAQPQQKQPQYQQQQHQQEQAIQTDGDDDHAKESKAV